MGLGSSSLCCNKPPRWLGYTLKSETHWYIITVVAWGSCCHSPRDQPEQEARTSFFWIWGNTKFLVSWGVSKIPSVTEFLYSLWSFCWLEMAALNWSQLQAAAAILVKVTSREEVTEGRQMNAIIGPSCLGCETGAWNRGRRKGKCRARWDQRALVWEILSRVLVPFKFVISANEIYFPLYRDLLSCWGKELVCAVLKAERKSPWSLQGQAEWQNTQATYTKVS